MSLFRRSRRPPADPSPAIAEFWQWWHDHGARSSASAIASTRLETVAKSLGERVTAIHPDLEWELAPGRRSEHALVVTAAGRPELRAVARRWLREAIAPDQAWEYAGFRRPAATLEELRLGIAGHELAFADVTLAARRTGNSFDVEVNHPRFPDLDESARAQVAFLALDSALGEQS